MAQQGAQLDQETFSCSICLDLLKDPVTLPCGHSFCMKCINSFWDGEDQVYSCPQCRQAFTPRPVLVKNTMLAALSEQLKKTGVQSAASDDDHCYAGAEDVSCDVCIGRKLKAVKSCLVCLASYCEKHLQRHYDVAPLKKHELVDPWEKLQENICSRHDEVMKMFCCTDQQIICYLCSVEEHKGHDIVLAAAERTERRRQLDLSRQNIQKRIQDREKNVKLLQEEVEAVSRVADKAAGDSKKIFTELILLLQERGSDVEQQIRSQQETEVSRARELQKELEQEIVELKRKDAELELLSHTEDHNQFLQESPSLTQLSELSEAMSSIKKRPPRHFEFVGAAESKLRDQVQNILKNTRTNISLVVKESEPKTRAGFLQYARDLTMDPNTVNTSLLLFDGNRKAERKSVEWMCYNSTRPSHHPDRFTPWGHAMSRESLTGRCYWEVEWKGGSFGVDVAVAYKNMTREGGSVQQLFGLDDKSWRLDFLPNKCTFWFNDIKRYVSGPRPSSRVGVYLDHTAGLLSFYSVSETMTLLRRVQTTFTQPLYAGLGLYGDGDTIEFCELTDA